MIPTFYIDDSSCVITGKKHTLLGAITFEEDPKAIHEVLKLKEQLGIGVRDEIKWNSQNFSKEQREYMAENILPVLSTATGCLVIDESGKQSASYNIAIQLSDYCKAKDYRGFICRFDKQIITEEADFDEHAYSLNPPCVGWTSNDSAHDQLIQCADLFVGFQKLRIKIGTQNIEEDKKVNVEVFKGKRDEADLSWYLSFSLRFALWGIVPEHEPGDPWKINLDYGLRVFSSVQMEEVKKAISQIESEFLGCIH